ncbi:Qat anti-phage system ATPase QatA [Mesorhizobium sp. B2-7-1]|uniref:Qat anti-phage system ATPase QatA n=1 Tax=Mesorhizobium sp. B2-7-1 TaxID=2589909 RepID=UPI00112A50DF|nr:Qat anti-phage system ATPase QatA [Mesorhizobium sp. B2-7-1]TPJ41053.1 NTPase KAP [Mesorhizobium sp. B2-7-1]
MIIADNETAVDYLYYETVAKTVVTLIKANSGEPLTIGLHGDWGAGKSSTLLMVETAFGGDDRTLCVRFNGWLFEGYDDAKAVLIETIVAELLKKRSGITKVADKAAEVLKSVNWFKVARTVGGAALSFATGLPNQDIIRGISSVAQGVIANPSAALTGEMFNKVLAGAADHFKASSPAETAPQRMHAFREDFAELLERADIDRLIVLVDDLDRCLPTTAIATLEAIRLFLFVPNAAFVIAADEGMIEYAVRNHFPDLPASTGPNSYARSYLEKLIQVPFRMPALGSAETKVYLTLLLYLSSGVDPSSDEFGKVLEVARESLKRPWLGTGFDRAAIGKQLKPLPSELDAALQVAAEITPILTEGARGNPRQIKRFVNTMALRVAIAEERGFQDEIKQAVLAKLMLAERFAPEVFDAIALDAAAEGSNIMAELEGGGEKGTSKKGPVKKGAITESSMETWPNIEWARRWAKIQPSLAGIDLRPYVFVSRDRRAAFTASLILGPLEDLIERLSSVSLTIAQVPKAELGALSPSDAERVFQGLISKIDAVPDLEARPVAAEGLAALCGTRVELREPLIGYLGRLPVSKIGPWVVNGWGAAVEGTHAASFANLIKQWSEQDQNKNLRTIAAMQRKTAKPRAR